MAAIPCLIASSLTSPKPNTIPGGPSLFGDRYRPSPCSPTDSWAAASTVSASWLHTTWCAVAVVAGTEYEERFSLDESGHTLLLTGTRTDQAGTVSGFAPPSDIHRVTNAGATVGISLHIYGTDIARIGNSVRRTYDLPIVGLNEIAGATKKE